MKPALKDYNPFFLCAFLTLDNYSLDVMVNKSQHSSVLVWNCTLLQRKITVWLLFLALQPKGFGWWWDQMHMCVNSGRTGVAGVWGGGKAAAVTPVDKCFGWQMRGQGQQPKHESSVLRQEGKEGGWDMRTSHYLMTWWHHPFLSLLERVVILDFGGLVNQAASHGSVILQFEEITVLKLLIFLSYSDTIYFNVYFFNLINKFSYSIILHVLCK